VGCFGKASFPQVSVLLGNGIWGWLGDGRQQWGWCLPDRYFDLHGGLYCSRIVVVSGVICPAGRGQIIPVLLPGGMENDV